MWKPTGETEVGLFLELLSGSSPFVFFFFFAMEWHKFRKDSTFGINWINIKKENDKDSY